MCQEDILNQIESINHTPGTQSVEAFSTETLTPQWKQLYSAIAVYISGAGKEVKWSFTQTLGNIQFMLHCKQSDEMNSTRESQICWGHPGLTHFCSQYCILRLLDH